MPIDLRSIRDRKLVHWALGGFGAAWLALQLFDTLAEALGCRSAAFLPFAVAVAGESPIVMVPARYDGKRACQRVWGSESVVIGGHSMTIPVKVIPPRADQ